MKKLLLPIFTLFLVVGCDNHMQSNAINLDSQELQDFSSELSSSESNCNEILTEFESSKLVIRIYFTVSLSKAPWATQNTLELAVVVSCCDDGIKWGRIEVRFG